MPMANPDEPVVRPDTAPPVLLMIAERFAPDLGGVARSAARTSRAIARLGWDVHVLAWTKQLPPGELESEEMFETEAEAGKVILHRLGLFANADLSMQHTVNVLEWLHSEHQFSAVWGHYIYPSGYVAVVFAETWGLPSTVSARGNDIDRLMFPPGDFARLIWTLKRATVVSCVSRDLANKVEMLTERREQILVVRNSVDTNQFRAETTGDDGRTRQRFGIAENEAILGFCGELRHKKGLPFILSALVQVRRSQPACLLIIGEVRPREQTQLAHFASEYPEAAASVHVTGRIDDHGVVANYIRGCDLLLQPSMWDGLPNAVLESMACGKVVIASDAGGIPEAIDHGKNGFLVPKALLNNLGQAVIDVLQMSTGDRKKIERRAQETIDNRFDAASEAARLRDVLEQLHADATDQSMSSS